MYNNMDNEQNYPGEIVLVNVLNPLENRQSTGKWRPAVLIEREEGHWKVMGLTRKDTYGDGNARTPVPNPTAVGLNGPGYLWGSGLTNVSVLDIGRHIGWVDLDLAATLIHEANLEPHVARTLVEAVLDWYDELGA